MGHAQVTVKPVLDLDEHVRVDAYEFPTAVSERTRLRCGGDVFPTPRTPRRCPVASTTITLCPTTTADHRPDRRPQQRAAHPDPPPGEDPSRIPVTQVDDGTYLWTTPHGLARLVDPDRDPCGR